jgi:pimeloyl-ACP methyl ester carboxylesterase
VSGAVSRNVVPNATDRPVALDDGASTTLSKWGRGGPSVLCIHGITSSRASWTRFAQRFSTRFRIYAYDQRGHGDSAAVRGPMTVERSSRDLANVAAAIGDPIDVLVGHSWGGAVALRGGAELQPRGVVAIDPMIRVAPGTFAADYVDDVRPLFALAGEARSSEIARMYASGEPADRDAKLHAMQHMGIESLEALGRENRAEEGAWDLRGLLVAYPVPLLLALAGEDSVVSADERAFVRECGGPKVTTRVFEGQGHNLQRTAFDAFAEAAQEFFSKIGL